MSKTAIFVDNSFVKKFFLLGILPVLEFAVIYISNIYEIVILY